MVKKKKKKRPQFNIWLEATKKFELALVGVVGGTAVGVCYSIISCSLLIS